MQSSDKEEQSPNNSASVTTMSVSEAKTDTVHEPYLSQIKAILEQVFGSQNSADCDCEIYLFGSRATNNYRDDSDFDISVLASREISLELSIARELLEDSNIPFMVELVDLGTTSEDFTHQVQQQGILLELE